MKRVGDVSVLFFSSEFVPVCCFLEKETEGNKAASYTMSPFPMTCLKCGLGSIYLDASISEIEYV